MLHSSLNWHMVGSTIIDISLFSSLCAVEISLIASWIAHILCPLARSESEIVCGVAFLHAQQIQWRDLKLENILIDANGHLVLIYFELSEKLDRGRRLTLTTGTLLRFHH